MNTLLHYLLAPLAALSLGAPVHAAIAEYTLIIDRETVDITGHPVERLTINGSLPGPVLRFTEGDDAVINVENRLDEDTSLHWHGMLLPDAMDGVPGLAGFGGIPAGQTFHYRFKVRQNGTYWYHAHTRGQEQDGLYGALVIDPAGADSIEADREHVIVLSDFHEEDAAKILANLKKSSEYYQYDRRTIGDFIGNVRRDGFASAWRSALDWGSMRMLPTDLSDVSGYTFLVNGKSPEQNWTGLFTPGERVKLRFINASAMSFYDVRIPGLPMTVVAADGRPVEPVEVDEFRFGVAETYDVIVMPGNRAYTIAAESIDREGFAQGTLAPRQGMQGPPPEPRPRALLTMADMGGAHDMAGHEMAGTGTMDHAGHVGMTDPAEDTRTGMPGMKAHDPAQHAGMDHMTGQPDPAHAEPGRGTHEQHAGDDMKDYDTGVPGSGWAKNGAPAGTRILSYRDLRLLGHQQDTRPPGREITIRLGGNMERYIWTLNGEKFSESERPVDLAYGERVRLKFVNDTMMAHPMHLHGMFVQLENGQPAAKLPDKHTIIVTPGDSYSVLLTADEPGEWAFHCHLIYHTMSGMMTKVVVAGLDEAAAPHGGPASGTVEKVHGGGHVH